MTEIETLLAKLADRGLDVTADQAEAMAIRLAGSVTAYLAELAQNDEAAEAYTPAAGEASEKFSAPLAYDLESPTASGLPT